MATDMATTLGVTTEPAIPPRRYRFAVDEFVKMYESGVLGENTRIELLEGELFIMSPQSAVHIAVVAKMSEILWEQLAKQARVFGQSSLELNNRSLLEPDVVVAKHRDDNYLNARPQPRDVLLLIEVAHTSLEYDRSVKLPIYAAANIPEVWIVDTNTKSIEQYSDPHENRYRKLETIATDKRIASLKVPKIEFTVNELFS